MVKKLTYKWALTPQFDNGGGADMTTWASYVTNNRPNYHSLVRVYLCRPRSGYNIDNTTTMAGLIT